MIADEKTCYVILESYYGYIVHGFGEFDSLVPNDPYNSFLAGHGKSTRLPASAGRALVALHYTGALGQSERLEMHRTAIGTFAGDGCPVRLGSASAPGGSYEQSPVSSANTGLGFYTIPMFITCDYTQENGLYLLRGKLRGIHNPIAYRPKNHLEEYVDEATGKTMLCIHWGHYSLIKGCFMFDISGPW